MQGRGGLKFHTWSGAVGVVVLAVVLGEALVESQYYFQPIDTDGVPATASSRSQYYFYDDQEFIPANLGEEEPSAFPEAQDPVQTAPLRRHRRAASDSDEDDESDDDGSSERPMRRGVTLPAGRSKPVHLPKGFNDRVNKRIKMNRRSKTRLHGDPDPIHDDDEEGRKPEGRLLWPFSIEITKGAKDKGGGWGGPGGYGSGPPPPYGPPPHGHGPPPRSGLGFGVGLNDHKFDFGVKHDIPQKQHARIGLTKGRFPPGHGPHGQRDRSHFHVSGGYGPQNGWGWDSFIEHEKHRLKYEILKLKAKKKIAVLQNKVELKKLFSMLLQKKIQALEWW